MEHVHEHPELSAGFSICPWFRTEPFDELWNLLHEFPENHFDDDSPKTPEAFQAEMIRRLDCGEGLWAIRDAHGELAGAIGLASYDERSVIFHGIAFRRALHGTGLCAALLRHFLAVRIDEWKANPLPIYACYYDHNRRIQRFLEKLGFEHVRELAPAVQQQGVPVRIRLVFRLWPR